MAKFAKNESGATSVEYALMISFIGIAIFTSVQALGIVINGIFINAAGFLGS
jgi:pilus assembly protein Flp/PilA